MSDNDLAAIEAEIDAAFADNKLAKLPYAQCMWTLLSVVEDHNFKISVVNPLPDNEARIYVDSLLNALTYPLRVCHQVSTRGSFQFSRRLTNKNYALADKWLDASEDYSHFCTMFPLYHANEIELSIKQDELIPTDWAQADLSYEVYDRFVLRRDPETETRIDPARIARELEGSIRIRRDTFSLNFTKRVVDSLIHICRPTLIARHTLPDHWVFNSFSLQQFRIVLIFIQSLAHGWFLARQLAAERGVRAMAYASAVWTPRKADLQAMIVQSTGVRETVAASILRYLTFGEVGIRAPDIAIQPIVDLSNDHYAISPFLLLNVNAERNLCVLLNQIPAERKVYSRLVAEKEDVARDELIGSLTDCPFDFRFGPIKDTDIDLAIVDRATKKCLCIEIKWFIEPAEIREVMARSEEISRGVVQALKINELFENRDSRLLSLLEVDESYDLLTMVGSVNFIGRHGVQHPEVPIAKLWHVGAELRANGSLDETMKWLRARTYLPKKDIDYKISTVEIRCEPPW